MIFKIAWPHYELISPSLQKDLISNLTWRSKSMTRLICAPAGDLRMALICWSLSVSLENFTGALLPEWNARQRCTLVANYFPHSSWFSSHPKPSSVQFLHIAPRISLSPKILWGCRPIDLRFSHVWWWLSHLRRNLKWNDNVCQCAWFYCDELRSFLAWWLIDYQP